MSISQGSSKENIILGHLVGTELRDPDLPSTRARRRPRPARQAAAARLGTSPRWAWRADAREVSRTSELQQELRVARAPGSCRAAVEHRVAVTGRCERLDSARRLS